MTEHWKPIIAVDFDGTIVDHEFPKIGAKKYWVREALAMLRRLGFHVLIYSCRTCKWFPDALPEQETTGSTLERVYAKEMKDFLDAEGLEYDSIDDGALGKPPADFYIDDKGVRFEDNWPQIVKMIAGPRWFTHAQS